MVTVNAEIKWQGNDNDWFTDNASEVFEANIQIFHTDGRYKFTDGVTALAALQWRGDSGGGGGSQDLQSVTDNGYTTTNQIQAEAFGTTLGFSAITEGGAIFLKGDGANELFKVDNDTDTVTYKEVEVETKPTQKTGTALTFENNAVYGTIASPETSNITFSTTDANLMTTLLVIHNSGTAPTFAANMRETNVSKGYST
ncbi:MAG: hypothetical protein EKK61_03635, partial [Rickettsiales bacterium]